MASKLRLLPILLACGIALYLYSGNAMVEIRLPVPSEGRPAEPPPAESAAPVASEPRAAHCCFEAQWRDPKTGWQGEPYERFWDARCRVLEEMHRGAVSAGVVHIPTDEFVFIIERGRVAPGCNLRERPPAPPGPDAGFHGPRAP
jgi:hypothetical protein